MHFGVGVFTVHSNNDVSLINTFAVCTVDYFAASLCNDFFDAVKYCGSAGKIAISIPAALPGNCPAASLLAEVISGIAYNCDSLLSRQR
jgi:hypothetical protein